MKAYKKYSLLPYNTFGIDVTANLFVEYDTVDELTAYLKQDMDATRPLLHIGGGSNLLFTHDYEGVIMHSAIGGIALVEQKDGKVQLKVGAGVVWDDFVAYTVAHGWYGAENLSLIPGEVGASAVQNIGAYGVEAKDIISYVDAVEIATGATRRFMVDECQYAYRSSIFKHELKGKYIITHVCFTLSEAPEYHLDYGNIRAVLDQQNQPLSLQLLRDTIIGIRRAKLPEPEELGNAGSFFMNPIVSREVFHRLIAAYPNVPHYIVGEEAVKIPAGWLIDQCGWKGKSLGPAAVYQKQALVLVNKGGATGDDVVKLAQAIMRSVEERFGVKLQPEVMMI